MKTLIKTLAVLTAGVGAVAVVKRVSEKLETLNHKTDSTNGAVTEALSMAAEAKETAGIALEKATAESRSVVNYVDSQIVSLKSEVLAFEKN